MWRTRIDGRSFPRREREVRYTSVILLRQLVTAAGFQNHEDRTIGRDEFWEKDSRPGLNGATGLCSCEGGFVLPDDDGAAKTGCQGRTATPGSLMRLREKQGSEDKVKFYCVFMSSMWWTSRMFKRSSCLDSCTSRYL